MQRIIYKYTNQLTAISFTLIILAFIFGDLWKDVLLITATIVASVPIVMKAYQALRFKAFSIELLVTIAVIGALFIEEYVESAVVTFLFLFGTFLESRTLEKTRSSIKELTEMAPDEAIVIRDGIQQTIDVDDVMKGERVIIYSGGKIPVDGRISSGEAYVNEAAVSGESYLVYKQVNDQVFSGTIIDNGYVEMIAEKVGTDTTFAKIIELVEEAQETKSKREKFLDKFANIYTPIVVAISAVVYLLIKDIHMAITFLVIACPGALVIGVPVSNVAGIGNGAKNGVLIKGGEVMDELAKVDTIVFDKTGTLTKGKPQVTDIKLFTDGDEDELLARVAQAELLSEHPLGKTIVQEAKKRQLTIGNVPQGEIIKGSGLKAFINNDQLVIGNRKLMKDEQITITLAINEYAVDQEKKGNTVIFISQNKQIIGVISIADAIRNDAREAIAELRNNGVKQMIMLTGDNEHAALLVAEQLNLDRYEANLLPEHKVRSIEKLQTSGHTVAMVGDGINDAPAIAMADIGLAMGIDGTDVSMETADIVLMADQLTQLSHAYALSQATVRHIKQNIVLAIGTVFLLLIGVLQGKVHLASGMFIHEASILLVILNGMRLIRFRQSRIKSVNKRDDILPKKTSI